MIKSALIIPQKEDNFKKFIGIWQDAPAAAEKTLKGRIICWLCKFNMLVLQIYSLTAGAGHGIVIEYEVEVIRFSPVRPERRLQVNNRKARYICV